MTLRGARHSRRLVASLAGLASAYDPRRGPNLSSRVVGQVHIDGKIARWEAEAGWPRTYAVGAWDGDRIVSAVGEYSEDLDIIDE